MMSGGDCYQTTIEEDSSKLIDWLKGLRLQDTALDQQATNDLVGRCLENFDDLEASAECRAIALCAIVAQLSGRNPAILARLPDVCQSLKTHAVVTQPLTDPGLVNFHLEVLNAISVILGLSPEKLVDRSFAATMHYLVQLVSSDDIQIATAACQFWATYAAVPVNTSVRRRWMGVFLPRLPTLIAALIDQMIYRPALADYMEQFASRAGQMSLPDDVESYASLRNSASVALERIASAYPVELICASFRAAVEKRLESESWSEKEAAILALAAFTQGAGITDTMRDLYALAIPRVLECYSDPHPLLRSIACLTMPKLVGHGLRGVRDPWSRVLTSTATATRDSCAEVRSVAIRALSSLLGYCVPSERASRGIDGQTARLVDALVSAGQCDMDTETRCEYFNCVSHLVGRASNSLTAADMGRLLPPLIDEWRSLTSDQVSPVEDADLRFVPLSGALSTIATYGKLLYAPYAENVFEKACAVIEGIINSRPLTKARDDEDESGRGISPAMTSQLISCLNLLTANYDGLATAAAQYCSKFHLLRHLHAILAAPALDDRIYQSAYALLGHVLEYETGPTDPPVDVFLEVIRSTLDAPETPIKTRANALRALVSAAANPSASLDHLFQFTDTLTATFMRTNNDPRCIINAAWALTTICAARPTYVTSVHVVTRRDVFLHLSGLLRAQFPRPLEKQAIAINVCRMLAPVIDQVPAELWPVFLAAVVAGGNQVMASGEIGTNDLHVSLKSLIRDIRSTLGRAGWTRALQGMGVQDAGVLRRRYRLR